MELLYEHSHVEVDACLARSNQEQLFSFATRRVGFVVTAQRIEAELAKIETTGHDLNVDIRPDCTVINISFQCSRNLEA